MDSMLTWEVLFSRGLLAWALVTVRSANWFNFGVASLHYVPATIIAVVRKECYLRCKNIRVGRGNCKAVLPGFGIFMIPGFGTRN